MLIRNDMEKKKTERYGLHYRFRIAMSNLIS